MLGRLRFSSWLRFLGLTRRGPPFVLLGLRPTPLAWLLLMEAITVCPNDGAFSLSLSLLSSLLSLPPVFENILFFIEKIWFSVSLQSLRIQDGCALLYHRKYHREEAGRVSRSVVRKR